MRKILLLLSAIALISCQQYNTLSVEVINEMPAGYSYAVDVSDTMYNVLSQGEAVDLPVGDYLISIRAFDGTGLRLLRDTEEIHLLRSTTVSIKLREVTEPEVEVVSSFRH